MLDRSINKWKILEQVSHFSYIGCDVCNTFDKDIIDLKLFLEQLEEIKKKN